MYRVRLLVLVGLLSPWLSGCLMVRSNVTAFHTLPKSPSPTTYAFLPLQGQENDLEYKTYKNRVAEHLTAYQFREVPAASANVFVAFGYSIGAGKQRVSSVPIFGQTGVSSASTFGTLNTYGSMGTYSGTTYYTPTYGVVGSQTVSRTKYDRYLWLHILERPAAGSEKAKVIYQAEVQSAGYSGQISKVMPTMIKALFKEFPGESGKSRRETLPIE